MVVVVIVLSSDNTSGFNGSSMNNGSLNGSATCAQTIVAAKQKSIVATMDSQQGQQNTRARKERKPNWSSVEVLALIHAKEKEHQASRLTSNARDEMIMANIK